METADANTIAFWIKSNVEISGAAEASFVRKQFSGAGYILEFHGPSGGLCYWTNWPAGVIAAYTIKANEWYHFAGTWDGKTANLYANGKLLGSEASVATGLNTHPVHINGFGNPPNARWYDGTIDEVAIYNRALSDQEVETIMKSGVFASVTPSEKLSTTWGIIRRNF